MTLEGLRPVSVCTIYQHQKSSALKRQTPNNTFYRLLCIALAITWSGTVFDNLFTQENSNGWQVELKLMDKLCPLWNLKYFVLHHTDPKPMCSVRVKTKFQKMPCSHCSVIEKGVACIIYLHYINSLGHFVSNPQEYFQLIMPKLLQHADIQMQICTHVHTHVCMHARTL